MRPLTISIFFLLIAGAGLAQEKVKNDSMITQAAKVSYRPTQLRFATDVVTIVKSFAQDDFNGWEVNFDMDLSRYYLAADIGSWSRDLASDNDQYSNSGTYFRLGGDINFLLKDEDKNVLFFGGRYARSFFSETMVVNTSDPVWGDFQNTYSSDGEKARWFELTGGLKVRMWKNFWLGYTARYKFWLKTTDVSDIEPSDIPGYGSTNKKSTWGFNYQVLFSIPLPKKK